MKLNKGWTEGTIGIPGRGTFVHFYVKRYKSKGKYGIDGGSIEGLIINSKNDTLAYYAGKKGWIIKPSTEEAEIALQILLLEK